MSLRAKIEAVIYAADEPVTLAQLAAVFAAELPAAAPTSGSAEVEDGDVAEERPSIESLLERGFLEAANDPIGAGGADLAEVALLTGREEQNPQTPEGKAGPPEADAKRAARQRDREARAQVKAIVDGLIEEYASGDRGMEIREVAGGYRIATKPEYHEAVLSFVKGLKPAMKLSLQALETLAVIAYKQPVTAPEVGEIRGVDSSGVLGSLMGRKLITTAGRKPVVGRPILYKTTREFLLRFGLKDLNELPSIEEFEKLAGEIEIGEDEAAVEEDSLPFGETNAGDRDIAAVDANAGEPGIAIDSAEALLEGAPATANTGDASLTAALPPTTVEIVDATAATAGDPAVSEEVNNGRNS